MDITALTGPIGTFIYAVFVVIGIFLIVYLTYVLIRPERF
jgi:K+-transporting ATPase KdpF subunit